MIKRILLLNMIMIIVSLVNVSFVFGQECTYVPFPCISFDACGYKECDLAYTVEENANVNTCTACETSCSPQPGCRSTCYPPKSSATAASKANAKNLQSIRRTSGTFSVDIVPCGEMNSCIDKGDITKFSSFARLNDCNGDLSPNMKARILENHPASQWEGHLPNTFENNQLIQAGKQLSPENLAQRIQTGGLQEQVVFQTDAEILAHESVRTAMANVGIELPFLKQIQTMYYVVKNNAFVKAIGYVKSAYSTLKGAVSSLEGDNEDSRTAAGDYYIEHSGTSTNAGTSSWKTANIIIDNLDGSEQALDKIPSRDLVTLHTSIVIEDPLYRNMYTLKGFENKGIEYLTDVQVRIHEGGNTRITVTGEGAPIIDANNNDLFLYGGSHNYYGLGTEDIDTYLSDSVAAHLNSATLFDATKDTSGDEFGKVNLKDITGEATFNPSEGQLAMSFDHFTLPNFQNAIDLGQIPEGYQLLARGFGDMVLLGQINFFPLFVRNVLKGDTAIIFNKGVKIINTYIARDALYDYLIKADNKSTKVVARNGKIIQDSGGLPLFLTPRQRSLIYDIN